MPHSVKDDTYEYCPLTTMYSAVSLASVAEDMTFLIMCAILSIAPLFPGMSSFKDKIYALLHNLLCLAHLDSLHHCAPPPSWRLLIMLELPLLVRLCNLIDALFVPEFLLLGLPVEK